MINEQEFNQIYNDNKTLINSAIRNFLTNQQDIEDIEQKTWLKFWRNRDKFKGNCKISTYLYRIACNCVYDLARKNKSLNYKKTGLSDLYKLKQQTRSNQYNYLTETIEQLTPKLKQVINLSMCGFAQKEIAEIEQVTANTINSRAFNARKKLKQYIKNV